MSQITKWFLLNDLDIYSTDTTTVSGQMITASGLCEIAQDHLELLTGITATTSGVVTTQWDTVVATMAAELYTKQGKNGFTAESTMGESATIASNYSASVLNMITRFQRLYKHIGTIPIVPPS